METGTKVNPDTHKTVDPEILEGKLFAAIGYLSFLCFIPLFLKRENKFTQFHGRQALVLFILEAAAFMLIVVPFVGEVTFRLAGFVFGIFSLAGIVKVLMHEYWEMPVIHQIASKITL
jgi:fumarate reductase subunit D